MTVDEIKACVLNYQINENEKVIDLLYENKIIVLKTGHKDTRTTGTRKFVSKNDLLAWLFSQHQADFS